MKLYTIKTDGTIDDRQLTATPGLTELQAGVGGLIEEVRLPPDYPGIMLVNEEGQLNSLPYNHEASVLYMTLWKAAGQERGIYLVGDVLLISGTPAELAQL